MVERSVLHPSANVIFEETLVRGLKSFRSLKLVELLRCVRKSAPRIKSLLEENAEVEF